MPLVDCVLTVNSAPLHAFVESHPWLVKVHLELEMITQNGTVETQPVVEKGHSEL
jgi:hypothetical protein